jgi:hypothetical protein
MAGSYAYENARPGRHKAKIDPQPPKGFSLHLNLMKNLDRRGWYSQLGERREFERMGGDPCDYEVDPRLRRLTDPVKIDRFMCRNDAVAECKTEDDLKVARFNGRIVLEIDPACPNDILFKKNQDSPGAC